MAKDVEKADWPRLPNGTVDWESVFEAPETGLILLIESAGKSQTVIDCAAMIIQTLFARESDEDVRGNFTKELLRIATAFESDLSKTISETITVLRGIKQDRTTRAADWAAHNASRSIEKERAARDARLAEERKLNADDAEFIFADVFCDILDKKLQVLWTGVDQSTLNDRALPFIVSSAFALTFETIVRESFMPYIVTKCRYIISEAKRHPGNKRRPYLEDRLSNQKTISEIWTIWQSTWSHFMDKADYPPKPEEDKPGIFGAIKRIVKDTVDDEGEYTIDDWHHDVVIIDEQNAEASAIREKLLAPSKTYQAPEEQDFPMLMKIFALNAGDLRKNISALLQIAADKDKAAHEYNNFQRGKQLELALIAASFQNPEVFLLGDQPMLPFLFRGVRPQELQEKVPYIVRQLPDLLTKSAKV